jgi:phosphoserine phosphatase RsbU/P
MAPGDLLLLYTDGITEAMSPKKTGEPRDLFGVDRLDKLLLGCHPVSAAECLDKVRAAVMAFSRNEVPNDDQTLIAIRCL